MLFRRHRSAAWSQGTGAACAYLAAFALLVAGCGGGGGDESETSTRATGGGVETAETPEAGAPLGPAEAKETIAEAEKRIAKALSSGSCEKVNALNPLSRPAISTDDRCTYLRRLEGLETSGAQDYGGAGGVIDYESGTRTISAVLVVDQDGLYHVAFLNPYNEEPSVGTPYAQEFDDAAKDAVAALRKRDCDRYLEVVFRRFGRGAGSEADICAFVDQNPIANLYEANPDAELEKAGGNSAYAFYTLGTPGVNLTIILAREQEEGAPPNAPPLPEEAAEYGYVDVLRTNSRTPPE